ncbi:unnamed protein product, partial [Ectocarpus sp. 12 AP-2014]
MNGHFIILLGLVLTVLLIATGAAQLLKRRAGADNLTIQNLTARINAWWVMVAIMAIAFLAGTAGVV